jgi:hypothetical protein
LEGTGRLVVRSSITRFPLPEVYVKVYSKNASSSNNFVKDGFTGKMYILYYEFIYVFFVCFSLTDLRGVFDYASVNKEKKTWVDRYALLILSSDHGSYVTDVKAPAE